MRILLTVLVLLILCMGLLFVILTNSSGSTVPASEKNSQTLSKSIPEVNFSPSKNTDVVCRVTGVPLGEAPQSVREAWKGVALLSNPIANTQGRGVLTQSQVPIRAGYQVPMKVAIESLERAGQYDAARWWHSFSKEPFLLFPADSFECKVER